MGDRWDISLFHYRYTGTSTGLVLLGVVFPVASFSSSSSSSSLSALSLSASMSLSASRHDVARVAFEAVVAELGWAAKRETDSVAARLFL